MSEGLLAEDVRRPVTLVSGLPGSGKTTLLASWARSGAAPSVVWLTVDKRDNRPDRLAEVVAGVLTRPGDAPRAERSPAPEDLLDVVFEQVMEGDDRYVLVLEDAHEVRSPEALRTLAYLAEQAPPSLDVILSARADPPIGWERVGLDGRLREIRYDDLAFDEAEAAELAANHGVELTDEDVGTLCARTEGWAAGLRLAVGALQSEPDAQRFIADAAATQAAVADYLFEEVLMRQDKVAQDLLLRTSVTERFTPDLATALTEDERSSEHLGRLARQGLFLIELEDQGCYRYHSLFRALLQAHLQQRDPGLAGELHRRAAAWHLAHGTAREAEEHARAAGDWELAGSMILRRWLEGIIGEGDPFADGPLGGVPSDAVLRTPSLALVAAMEACRRSEHDDADLYRSIVDDAASADGLHYPGRGEQATWNTALLLSEVTYGWAFGASDRSRAAVAKLHELTSAEVWVPRVRQLAVLAQAEQAIDSGDLAEARWALEDLHDQGEGGWHRTLSSAFLALVEASAGAVQAAGERLAAIPAEVREDTIQPTVHFVHLASSLCRAQRGKMRHAAGTWPAATPMEWPSRSLRFVSRALRAVGHGSIPFFVNLDARTARHPLAERALIALGVLHVVDTQGRLVALGGEGERVVAAARQRLREGPLRGQVLDALTSWLDSTTPRHPRTLVEAGVLAAIAAHQQGEHESAKLRLGEALGLAMGTEILAPILTHGVHLGGLLEGNLDGLTAPSPATFELLDRLQHPGAGEPVETLTDREIEVLRRLPTLMSNAEIARGMHLSVNTVKTHLKSVYRKLGVDSRREAVLRGRELELL